MVLVHILVQEWLGIVSSYLVHAAYSQNDGWTANATRFVNMIALIAAWLCALWLLRPSLLRREIRCWKHVFLVSWPHVKKCFAGSVLQGFCILDWITIRELRVLRESNLNPPHTRGASGQPQRCQTSASGFPFQTIATLRR